jgi:nucleoside-diphosphate-sugar epimerase
VVNLVTILVTGAAGFVGTTFMEYFHKKYDLIGIDWRIPKDKFPGVKYYQTDILDTKQLKEVFLKENPNRVVHFAAQARVEASLVNPIGTFQINVAGTINLLEMAKIMNLDQFIYTSSEVIYGKADTYPCKEIQSFKPDTPYAASKVSGDVITQNARGINWVVARPGMGYGPRSDPKQQIVARFLWNIVHDRGLRFPADTSVVHPTRDINYIGNFMRGLELVIEKDARGVYNLGSGKETSMLELAQIMVKVLGKGIIMFDRDFHYRAGEEGMRTYLDISKAQNDLGYNPQTTLEEGIPITYKWLKDHTDYWDS